MEKVSKSIEELEKNSEMLIAGLGENKFDQIAERTKKAYAQHNL